MLHTVNVYYRLALQKQLRKRYKFIPLRFCSLYKRRQVFLYLKAIVVAKYYAARMQLGYHGIEYRLCAALFFPVYGITGGYRMEQGKKCRKIGDF